MKHTIVGIDIAKRVFRLHWVDVETGEIISLQLKREKFLDHFINRQPCLIGMEVCGGSQHWARELIKLGHEVKLMTGKLVKSFVMGNKGDLADVKAIWTSSTATRHQTHRHQIRATTSDIGIAPYAARLSQDAHHANQCAARIAY